MGTEENKVLEQVGRWQILLLLCICCNISIVAINHALPAFHGYTPPFYCEVQDEVMNVTRHEGCLPNGNECVGGYQFESARHENSIVTEWSLVCERRVLAPLVATLYYCGVTLGALAGGLAADRYGRRPVMLGCLYSQGAIGALLYLANSLEVFIVMRFIQGFLIQSLQGTTYTLLMELFPSSTSTVVGVVIEFYWALGLAILATCAYVLPDWRWLELALTVPTLLTLCFVCFVPESPRWLVARGRHIEAQLTLDRISRLNGKSKDRLVVHAVRLDNETEARVVEEDVKVFVIKERKEEMSEIVKPRKCRVFDMFTNKLLRRFSAIMAFVWFSVSLSYYGIMFYLPALSGDRHLNFLLGAILEATSYALAYFVLSRYGRRIPLSIYLNLSGALCIAVAVVGTLGVAPDLQTVLAQLGKGTVVSAFCAIFIYTSELFPTVVRAAAMGHCGFWGRVGSLVAPQLLFLGEYTSQMVPMICISVFAIGAGLATLFLPETLGSPLANTVQEAELINRQRKGKTR